MDESNSSDPCASKEGNEDNTDPSEGLKPKRQRTEDSVNIYVENIVKDTLPADESKLQKAKSCEETVSLTIDDLFDELLQKIFSYFPAQEVFGHLSKVCVRWEQIAKDPSTLNQTQLFLDDSESELCVEFLKGAPCVGEVYVLPSHPPPALNHLISGPKVRKLVIIGDSDWHRHWPSSKDLIALLAHNQLTLQQLSMSIDSGLVHCHKTAALEHPSFQSLIAGMKRLSHLHLTGECWRDWDDWDWEEGHPHLQTLKIDSLTFVSDECPFIRDLIMLCKPTLRVLYLPCQLPDDATSLLNAGVFQGSTVEELLVSTGCLKVVSQMPYLKILSVSDNGKEDKDLEWFKKLPMLSGVWKLTLQSVLETEGEKHGFVWHLLSKFNSVREFWGLESSVEEDTFNMFLRKNPSLEEMHFLDFVGFGNPNQVLILENYLPKLNVLDLALNHVSDEMSVALHNFSEKRPTLKVVYDDDIDATEMLLPGIQAHSLQLEDS